MRKLMKDKKAIPMMRFILEVKIHEHFMLYHVQEISLKRAIIKIHQAFMRQSIPTMYLKELVLVKEEVM